MDKLSTYRTALDALHFLFLQTGDLFTELEKLQLRSMAVALLEKWSSEFLSNKSE